MTSINLSTQKTGVPFLPFLYFFSTTKSTTSEILRNNIALSDNFIEKHIYTWHLP